MARRTGKIPTEPVQISSRFTLRVLDIDESGRSLWPSRVFAAALFALDGSDEPSVLSGAGLGLTARLSDLTTGRTVDDVLGAWNAQVETDFENTVNGLRQLSDSEILKAFFEQPSE